MKNKVSENTIHFIQTYSSPLGEMTMVSDGEALIGLAFEKQRYFDRKVPENAVSEDLPIFQQTGKWLDIYFRGDEPNFLPKIRLDGSEFQRQVWQRLLQIPYGQVVTYGEIAAEIAADRGIAKMSAQAAGGAVGHNPVSILSMEWVDTQQFGFNK